MHLALLAGAAGTDVALELAGRCELTVIAPTTRDSWADGLKRCPDLDAFLTDPGHAHTYGVAQALEELDFGAAWHRAHDDEIALRLMRTELLHADFTLTAAIAALAERRRLPFALLPLSDDRGELRVVVVPDETASSDEESAGQRAVHLDEYRASLPVGAAPEPSFVALTWAVTDDVVAAIQASSEQTVAVIGDDPVMKHAVSALSERVPEARFINVAGAGVGDIISAAATPR